MAATNLVLLFAIMGIIAGNAAEKSPEQDKPSSCTSVVPANVYSKATAVPINTVFAHNIYSLETRAPVYYDINTPTVETNIYSSEPLQPTNGPDAEPLPVIQGAPVILPAVHEPVITIFSSPIPPIKVLAQRCICTKTFVKPQIIQRQVTVPKYKNYLRRTVTPVVENVSFKSTPITKGPPPTDIVIPGSAPVPAPAVVASAVTAPAVTTPAVTAPAATAPAVTASAAAAPVVDGPVFGGALFGSATVAGPVFGSATLAGSVFGGSAVAAPAVVAPPVAAPDVAAPPLAAPPVAVPAVAAPAFTAPVVDGPVFGGAIYGGPVFGGALFDGPVVSASVSAAPVTAAPVAANPVAVDPVPAPASTCS